MTIVYVCADPGVPVFGTKGASVHVQEVISVLLDAGHRVELFCRRTGGEPWPALAAAADAGRLAVHHLPAPKAATTGERERALIAADAGMREAVTARIGQLARTGDPVTAVYERYSLWSRAGVDAAAAGRVPSMLEVNAPLPEEQQRHRGLAHVAEAHETAAAVIAKATAVVCVSAPVARWARRIAGRRDDRLIVAANGVDTDRIRPTVPPSLRSAVDPVTIGFVGTLKPWHGTDVLLEAMALVLRELPARLLVVGDGPQGPELREQARALGIADAVEFTGAVDPTTVPSQLQRMDVGVAPYPSEAEGLPMYFSPLKVYEYLAAGIPVVASDVGGLAEVIDDGATGLLVPGSDVTALAGAIAALGADATLRHAMGRAARDRAEREHTWHRVVERSLAAAGLDLHETREAA